MAGATHVREQAWGGAPPGRAAPARCVGPGAAATTTGVTGVTSVTSVTSVTGAATTGAARGTAPRDVLHRGTAVTPPRERRAPGCPPGRD